MVMDVFRSTYELTMMQAIYCSALRHTLIACTKHNVTIGGRQLWTQRGEVKDQLLLDYQFTKKIAEG